MNNIGHNLKNRKKQVASFWHEYQWSFIGLLMLIAFLFGYFGFAEYFSMIDKTVSFWDNTYLSLQLFTLESAVVTGELPWQLQIARFLAPAVLIYTAIKALLVLFRDQLNMFRLRKIRDHVIVCGLGEKGYNLAIGFIERGEHVVGIELDIDDSRLDLCCELGMIVITGDAANSDRLQRAGINRASYLFSVCGDDSVNAMVGSYARASASHRKWGRLTAYLHISNPEFSDLLRGEELSMQYDEHFSMEFFNIYERGAHALLTSYPAFPSSSDTNIKSSHIIIDGLDLFGTCLLLALSRIWKVTCAPRGFKMKLFLVDTEIELRWHELLLRYPQLNVLDDVLLFTSGDNVVELERAISLSGRDQSVVKIAYICHDDERDSLAVALKLKRKLSGYNIQFVACTNQESGLGLHISDEKNRQDMNSRLASFALIDNTCTPDLLIGGLYEVLARTIHNNYVIGERAKEISRETNPAVVPWDELPETLKSSNRDQALHIGTKLQAVHCSVGPVGSTITDLVQFTNDEIEVLAKLEHQRWIDERKADGWKYGEGEKNIARKTSPHILDWDGLEETVKDYDRDAVRNIPSLVAQAGFEVYRLDKK